MVEFKAYAAHSIGANSHGLAWLFDTFLWIGTVVLRKKKWIEL